MYAYEYMGIEFASQQILVFKRIRREPSGDQGTRQQQKNGTGSVKISIGVIQREILYA